MCLSEYASDRFKIFHNNFEEGEDDLKLSFPMFCSLSQTNNPEASKKSHHAGQEYAKFSQVGLQVGMLGMYVDIFVKEDLADTWLLEPF